MAIQQTSNVKKTAIAAVKRQRWLEEQALLARFSHPVPRFVQQERNRFGNLWAAKDGRETIH